MWNVELYDRRYDWLVASILAIPLLWLFYGFDAAFVGALLFALVGALKPLILRLGSRLAAGVFAAGLILLLSPLFRYVFYTGYCFEGVWSPGAGMNRYLAPELCERGLFSTFGQQIWVGPLRDLTMPAAGLGLMVLSWLDPRLAIRDDESASQTADDDEQLTQPLFRRARLANWAMLFLAIVLWAGGSYVNYQAEQERLEQERQAEIAERLLEAAAAAEEAKRIAAEKSAKQVNLKWMLGGWVTIDGLSDEERADSKLFCATDTGFIFKADGTYHWSEESGKFKLSENNLHLFNRERSEMGDPDSFPEYLDSTTLKVERSGKRLIIDGSTYGRC